MSTARIAAAANEKLRQITDTRNTEYMVVSVLGPRIAEGAANIRKAIAHPGVASITEPVRREAVQIPAAATQPTATPRATTVQQVAAASPGRPGSSQLTRDGF